MTQEPDPDCGHPLDKLRLDPGRSGQRGAANTYMIACDLCEAVWPNATGLKLFLDTFVKDLESCWSAVSSLGGQRPLPTQPIAQSAQAKKEPCPHFLAWVKIEPMHGQSLVFRCTGCAVSWGTALGLEFVLTRLKTEQKNLRAEIARLTRLKEAGE